MESPAISRFSKLNKDMLIQLLETLSYRYTFSYDSSVFKIYICESSISTLLFSIEISILEEFTRFRALIDLLSGEVKKEILKGEDPNAHYAPHFLEMEDGEWIAGLRVCEIDYNRVHLGLRLNTENKITALEIFEGDDKKGSFILSLPIEKCNISNLREILEKMLIEHKKKDEEWKKIRAERMSQNPPIPPTFARSDHVHHISSI